MGPYPSLFDECRVVRARGELDLTTTPGLVRDLEDVLRGSGQPFLIVDLSGVTFMDSSVLDPLCAAWDECRRRRGWARVVYVRPCVGLLFRAGAVTERFPRYASVQDAWRGLLADGREQWDTAADQPA
ncbi:STAS domain-containing protein [Streptomyces sp. NPDC057298]|uniref:STAS domain-containing protein n=1 Tax=Streptomyces sp. NPDC057298 TaxID=3346091 RepID=UPI003627DF3D